MSVQTYGWLVLALPLAGTVFGQIFAVGRLASQAHPPAPPLRVMAAELPWLEDAGRWIGGPLQARPRRGGVPVAPALPGGIALP